MRFSILVPVYNQRLYLPDTLASVDAQTFRDFELVIVDDGSTDGSERLCDEYRDSHPGTVVLHQKNGGRVCARRRGLRETHGEYVLCLDGDDRLEPDALERINAAAETSNADVVIYNASVFDENGKRPFFEHILKAGMVDNKEEIYDKFFFEYCLNSMCMKAVRREVLDLDRDYSAFYDCVQAEDLLQCVPIIMAAGSIYYLDEKLYDYRVNSGTTHKCDPGYYWSNKKVNAAVKDLLKDERIENLEEKAAFHILIAAYAGTTQMKYAGDFAPEELEKIRADEAFAAAWETVWKGPYMNRFSVRQKLILQLLYKRRWNSIKLLLWAGSLVN